MSTMHGDDVSEYLDDSPPCSPSPKEEMIFRFSDTAPEAVRLVLLERGWIEFEEDEHDEYEWNLWWKTSRFRMSDYDHIASWQRMNHFPKTTAITKKDSLARNMRRLKGVYGANTYNFSPKAFNLPNDYTKFVAEYSKMKQSEDDDCLWICKPADLSRGRGIFIFRDLKDLQYDCAAVAQQYINNPLLISGYKFDLRIYVLVTCFHPLTIYIYKEGLVRFGTEKFDLNTLDNRFSHLTNTSINKLSPSYTTDKERVGPGCKWTLNTLRNYFHQQNIDDSLLWQRISNMVTLTTLAQAQAVPKVPNCFELFGFDILVDENMKPWLLEVNFSPALGLDTQIDIQVKKPMLNDLIDMLGYQPHDAERGGPSFKPNILRQTYSRTSSYAPNRRKASMTSPRKKTSVSSGNKLPFINKSNMSANAEMPSENASSATTYRNPQGGEEAVKDNKAPEQGVQEKTQTNRPVQRRPVGSRSSGSTNKGQKATRNAARTAIARQKFGSDSKTSINSDCGASVKSVSTARSSLSLPDIETSRQQVENRREFIRSREAPRFAQSALGHSSLTEQRHSRFSRRGFFPQPPDGSQPTERVQRGQTQLGLGRKTLSYPGNTAMGKISSKNASEDHNSQSSSKLKPRQSAMAKSMSHFQGRSMGKSRPLACVGDFVLTFPTNEVMRRACIPSLDIRAIIRELNKQLKQSIIALQKQKRSSNGTRTVTISGRDFGTMKDKRNEEFIKWEPMHPKARDIACKI
ncbi:tubulin polyglutamylase TTLL5-like [Ptychodera flava]|uniref:tubulin polyglutamylase TTLL5-like n=1 Tax=Ptychodera flava TaxID=63121 RepID=UPI00396A2EAC